MKRAWLLLSALMLFTPQLVQADTITFDGFVDSDLVGTLIPGLTFSNAMVISAGASLNEGEFPPRSGGNVVFDAGGTMTIDFDSPISSFEGYFTYIEALIVEAFDASDTLVASANSGFNFNTAVTGEPGSFPNEILSVTHIAGIGSIRITGNAGGGSFTMDDLTFQLAEVSVALPAPASILLFGSGIGALLGLFRPRRLRS